MGEIIYLSQRRIHITLYTHGIGWTRMHRDDQQTLNIINGVVKELGAYYFDVQTRPWWSHLLEALRHGGWRAPVVLVNTTVVSQGSVPDRSALRAYLTRQISIIRPHLAKSS